MSQFSEMVYQTVEKIPKGKVATYGQIARICGKPRGAREVGWAMRNCPEHLPWQRVVMANGCVAGGQHESARKALLDAEGIIADRDGKIDLKEYLWDEN